MMESLTKRLGLDGDGVAAVVGCGGKTSLLRLLATENSHRKPLVSTTTHIYPMQGSVGVYQEETGKLSALPEEALAALVRAYALVVLEADGSKGLPCKGWRSDEPVVPVYCTHTIGVVTLRALGLPATEANCHRLPLFLRLTGLRQGEAITLEALTRMVCAPEGMFQRSRGMRYLLVNQVEDECGEVIARGWLRTVSQQYPGKFAGLLYGSIHQNRWHAVEGEGQ